MAKNNMALWDKVCVTDPNSTKKVNQRGGFTAIDAMSQIKAATEQFGPAGQGWGWKFSEPIFPGNNTIVVKCKIWTGSSDQTIEQFGQKKLGTEDRPDEDAFKKAGTDALTKCLSYLGFNADVFLGLFDDNKYVEKATQAAALNKKDPVASIQTDWTGWANGVVEKLEAATTEEKLMALVKAVQGQQKLAKEKSPTDAALVTKVFNERLMDLRDSSKEAAE